MQFDRAKLKTVILYACSKCDAAQMGAVKLHKVLYFADMLHYAHVGTPITGATYRKRALGPTCDQLLPTLRDLDKEGALATRNVDYFGFRKKEYIPLKKPETNRLNESELSLLNDVIEFVCRNNTAKTISDYSHNRAWDLAEFGEVLPYHSVFHLFPTQVSQEAMEWASGEVKQIEAERSHDKAVGGTAFRDFRNRVLETRGQ
jgi:hypothetical protein